MTTLELADGLNGAHATCGGTGTRLPLLTSVFVACRVALRRANRSGQAQARVAAIVYPLVDADVQEGLPWQGQAS